MFTLLAMENSEITPMGRLLLDAFKWFDESLLASLNAQGWPNISHSQSIVMAYLPNEGIRISELARRLGISRQAAQKSVSELEMAKLVTTEIDPTNLSAKTVILTHQGKAIVKAALDAFAEIEQQLSARIGNAEISHMRMVLEEDWGMPIIMNNKLS
ncbi:MarR family winged helix-turn-helix transcriptional regulator [Methylotenera sp.]|uniref:MarR family winged helix-turn-helix transcriptional regulator n=1 Tax=Methylotenera sp. TaxID=2051956 RepID=UPI002735A565|nr:MarR family transcriptional regulator [Methylotenera sp.]MDP3307093.1 MarR family transcriptional regulator [Methylotenera sp.]